MASARSTNYCSKRKSEDYCGSRTINRPAPTSFTPRNNQLPRLLFDFDAPRLLWPVVAALPPPRLKFVPLGFFPELRFSPRRLPAAGPDGLRFFFAIDFARYLRRYFS